MLLEINDLIKSILHGLKNECNVFIDSISQIRPIVTNSVLFDNLISDINSYVFLIEQHIQANNLQIGEIYFSDIINSFFTNITRNKWHKHVEYFFQNELSGEKRRLVDDDEIRESLTLHDCLPIMSIVPSQIADNAIKYMPTGSTLIVEVIQTEKRKTIILTNIGPLLSQEELDVLIQKSGYRGSLAKDVHEGMGMGLFEVKSIVEMHWWLDPNIVFSSNIVSPEDSNFNYNGIAQAIFCIRIQLLNHSNIINKKDDDLLNWQKTNLPQITLHDLNQIVPKLRNQIRNITRNISTITKDKSWRNLCYRLDSYIDQIKELTAIATLVVFGNNDASISSIIGQNCRVDLQNTIINKSKNYNESLYANKGIKISYLKNPSDCSITVPSGIYILLCGIINTILEKSPKFSNLEIEFTRIKRQIIISFASTSIIFNEIFDKKIAENNADSLLWNKLHLYEIISSECNNLSIETNKNELIISL